MPEIWALKFDSETYRDGKVAADVGGVIPPLLFLVIFYIAMILLSNQMLNSTPKEKENQVTGMILTTLITGKIISPFMVGFVQILVFLALVGRLSAPMRVDSALQMRCYRRYATARSRRFRGRALPRAATRS